VQILTRDDVLCERCQLEDIVRVVLDQECPRLNIRLVATREQIEGLGFVLEFRKIGTHVGSGIVSILQRLPEQRGAIACDIVVNHTAETIVAMTQILIGQLENDAIGIVAHVTRNGANCHAETSQDEDDKYNIVT